MVVMETTSDSSATTAATTAATGPVTAGFGLHNMCDMCALPISEEELFQTELTAQGATCPTMMAFHRACYEAAAELWIPEGEDSTCRVDPLFPETAQWNQMQHAAQEIDG
jgi:hypothetical protein